MANSENLSRIQRVTGVPISEPGASSKDISDALTAAGVSVYRNTPSRLRSGSTSGEFIANRVEIAEILRKLERGEATVEAKDTLYHSIAAIGKQLLKNATSNDKHRLSSIGFVDDIAHETGIEGHPLRRMLRAMRTEMTFTQLEAQGKNLVPAFLSTAESTRLFTRKKNS